MSDGTRGNNVIPFNPRSGISPARPNEFTDPALSDRVAALETQLIALEANVTRERNLLSQLSESDKAMGAAAWGSAESARGHDSERNARALFERTVSDRQALAEQVATLRAERDALLSEIEALRLGVAPAATQPAPARDKGEKLEDVVGDLRVAVGRLVEEIRTPTNTIEDPSPALHEDVDELPSPLTPPIEPAAEVQKAR